MIGKHAISVAQCVECGHLVFVEEELRDKDEDLLLVLDKKYACCDSPDHLWLLRPDFDVLE